MSDENQEEEDKNADVLNGDIAGQFLGTDFMIRIYETGHLFVFKKNSGGFVVKPFECDYGKFAGGCMHVNNLLSLDEKEATDAEPESE